MKKTKPTLQVVTMPRVGRSKKTNGELKSLYAVKPFPVPQNPTRLDGVRLKIFLDRYAWKDEEGKPIEEVPEQMWSRVAKAIAQVEKSETLRNHWEEKFYDALSDFKFLPGGRILSAAGTGYEVTYYNCFVIPSPKDSRGGIIDNLKVMMEIMSRAGGVGINLSSLRPRGARVQKVNGTSSGPVSWASLYSTGTHDVIQQGGCFGEETQVMTHLGLVPIKEIVKTSKDWYAATHQGYQRITAKFDNGIKKLYQVKTAAGYSVKVTSEHKMLTVDKTGHFYLQELKDFKVGDPLTMLLGDWREDIPYVPLNTFIPAPSKFSYGRRKINLPKILDEKLAFLLGVYDADGSKVKDEFSANGKGLRIAVAANRPKDLEKIKTTIKDVFGLEPVVKPGDGAVLIVSIYSREVMEFLNLNSLLKEYSINVEVPQLFFSSPKKVVQAYIAGVFTGDGGNRGGKGGFRLSTVSYKYASDLQLLLLNLGIASKINTTDRSKLGWRNLYSVTINGHKFMKRFHQIVSGFCEKANDYAISKKDATFNWPFNLTEKFLYLSGFQRTIARTNMHTSQKAVQFLSERLPQINETERDDVAILANAVPDRITSIEYLGEKQVYDLEIENTHLLSGNGFYTSNSRRGALMLMLNDWHPDVEEFIEVKQDLSKINGANLSVCASDSFMEAVEADQDWTLRFPDTKHPKYDSEWDGDIFGWEDKGYPVKAYKTVKAKDIWDKICQAAWRSAEPGLVFMERYNKWSNTWYFEKIICVNPCVTGDTLIATENGWKRADEVKIGERISTVLGSGLVGRVEVYEDRPVYQVKFSDGAEVKVTAAHQFHAIVHEDRTKHSLNKKFKPLRLDQLKVGDLVRVSPALMPDKPVLDLPEGWSEKEYGFFIGVLIGDGCITETSIRRNVVKVAVNTSEKEWVGIIRNVLQKAGSKIVSLDATGGLSANLAVQNSGGAPFLVRQSYLKPGYSFEKRIPLEYQQTNREFLTGILDGLFSTDGNVNLTSTHPFLRLKTTSKQLALDIRRILLMFGIHGRVVTVGRVKDGHIGERIIHSRHQQYEVIISGASMKVFAQSITLSHPDKQKRLREAQLQFALTGNTWLSQIVSIKPAGREKVYDLYEPISDTWNTEGIISRGCGEQGLGAWSVCNLGALNVAAFVEDGQMNYEKLAEHAKIATRFLDNVVDANYYFYPENEKAQKRIRRTGLGTMGLGDALIKMKLRYGPESLETTEKIYKTIRDAAYEASSDIAKEKGSFPHFDAKKYLQGHFIKQLPETIKQKIAKQGMRNAVVLTQAPTGTTSLLAGVSSGIEPVYDFAFVRRDRTGESIMYHPIFKEWKDANPEGATPPPYFVSANDLTPDDHVLVQAMIQKYTDSSISKTVNAPNSHTVKEVEKLYMDAYKLGCKGITYMRDGSRDGVLSHISDKKEEPAKTENVAVPVAERPMILRGRTYKVSTPVGEAFITINRDEQNQPFEVFVTVGKGGMHTMADAEAMGRLVSLALRLSRQTSSPKEVGQKIAEQLRGIGGASSVGFGKNRVMSLADAIAKVLAEDVVLNGSEQIPETIPLSLTPADPQVNTGIDDVVGVSSKIHADLCPECGSASFVMEEGCKKCHSCGYSMC